jgi:hypothetical protein
MLEHSAHLSFLEERERYVGLLTSFLDEVEAAAREGDSRPAP